MSDGWVTVFAVTAFLVAGGLLIWVLGWLLVERADRWWCMPALAFVVIVGVAGVGLLPGAVVTVLR